MDVVVKKPRLDNKRGNEYLTFVSELGLVRARAHDSELRGGEESADTRFSCHPQHVVVVEQLMVFDG